MSDTITCANCSTELPATAMFCTTCGTKVEAAASAPDPAPAPAPGFGAPAADDATRVSDPGLTDTTVSYAPPPDPTPPPPAPPPAGAAPWQPADSGVGTAPPDPQPWSAPPPPAPAPSWEQPPPPAWEQPPTAAPGWGAPPMGGAPGTVGQPLPPGSPGAPGVAAWGAAGAASPSTWTPSSTPAPVPSPGASKGGSVGGGVLAIIGAILVLVGVFSPWLGSNQGSDTITGWKLREASSGFETKDPYLLLAIGIVAIIVAIVLFVGIARTLARVVVVLLGLAVILTHVRDWVDISDIVEKLPTSVKITAEYGFYLGIVGAVLLIVAALLPAKKTA